MAENAHAIGGVKLKATVRPDAPVTLRVAFAEPHAKRFELRSAALTVASGTQLVAIASERVHVR
jgi:hypothetical protein